MKTNKEIVLCQTLPSKPDISIYDRFFFQKKMKEKGERKRSNNHGIPKVT